MGAWTVIMRRSVVVNLRTGRAFSGVLWSYRKPLLVLRNAVMIDQGQHYPVDGEVVIELAQVEFIQALPGPA
jgi:small nuclear ribonucleoprotein (snRNP)-like protein